MLVRAVCDIAQKALDPVHNLLCIAQIPVAWNASGQAARTGHEPVATRFAACVISVGGAPERGATGGCAFQFSRNVAADQVAQRVDRFIRKPVVNARPPALAFDQAVLGHECQVAGNIGSRESTQLRQIADIALAAVQDVEYLQPGWLGKHLKVGRHLFERLGGHVLDRGGVVGLQLGHGVGRLAKSRLNFDSSILSLHN